ncbi:MAG: hypothetical protein KGS72_20200 [Cyanobacteria bacterium REEB67]|nr:hypothetical protein [Cyanobacteria bacterium REEB67]
MTSTAKTDHHVFEMVVSTQPTTMLLSPEAAACLREKLTAEERTIFDARLTALDFEGLKILCLSKGL